MLPLGEHNIVRVHEKVYAVLTIVTVIMVITVNNTLLCSVY